MPPEGKKYIQKIKRSPVCYNCGSPLKTVMGRGMQMILVCSNNECETIRRDRTSRYDIALGRKSPHEQLQDDLDRAFGM